MPPFPPANPDLLLTDLADPSRSLSAIAAEHGTNVAALLLWMTSPPIADRLNQLRDACVERARLAAVTLLPNCVASLHKIVDTAMADADAIPRELPTGSDADAPSSNAPTSFNDPRDPALRASALRGRLHDSARRAVALLLRIARWQEPRQRLQPATAQRASFTPSQRAVAWGGRQAATDPALNLLHLKALISAITSGRVPAQDGPRESERMHSATDAPPHEDTTFSAFSSPAPAPVHTAHAECNARAGPAPPPRCETVPA
ncbi:MAG: hypothetical protein KF768_04395 [Phycisphaeraceae bacterium]|nr:hypothetical protein [Phycisphaeraceae bacterium]